ncbi:DUF5129 domain-containing protein [Arthrobacter caoxuetaonis]|uniref:DUF5129 domain-containing protein n=1 Tax=Arthrobacter caoxuetaonis TaxID=2886935 RepID=A0A9X1SC93_9MICC|nr:DUF5129 domain-containing protein [Arthrobacter caoxuetaonis]MCC3297446.1 DUF5129 domain-containing protein [Arthrobacter caoxuetaonis]USQ58022.1 DUF5129 domain-containing protein [Arthrobacter caoxuetaonis]
MHRFLLLALTVLLALAVPAAPAAAVAPDDIVVDDTAGVLDLNTLLPALEEVNFRSPTTVAIYTFRSEPGREFDDGDTFMNEETLRYAREEHPEWISADGQKWADGLFIFSLDPEGRWIGTYFGEDRKVDSGVAEDIREEAGEYFADAQWTDGTIAGVEEAAKLINRPWYLNPALWVLAGGVVFVAAAVWYAVIATRRKRLAANRKLIAAAERSYSSVSMDLDATEVNARTIPDSSTYGARVLEEYRTFMVRYNTATELGNHVRTLSEKDLRRRSSTKPVEEFAELTSALDGLDDVIADTNTLLNMAPGWQAAWDRQAAPLLEELDKLDGLFEEDKTAMDSTTAAALLAFRTQCRRRIQTTAAGLAEESLTPEQALDILHDAGTELAALLKNHSETVIAQAAEDDAERELMREALEESRDRPRRYRDGYRPSILDTAYPNYLWTVSAFSSGVSSGSSSIESARSAASGSSSGYGASGGSFSGSGGSSRF